jgi:hypothetical protein
VVSRHIVPPKKLTPPMLTSIEDWFLPLPQNLIEQLIIPERDDIACQDHDISVHRRGQHPARAKFKMQVAISNDSHDNVLFEPVFLKC